MLILSQSKPSIWGNNYKLRGGYGIKNQNYAVIWSQMLILSQSKVSMNSKSSLTKVLKLTGLKKDMKLKVKIMQSFGHKCSFCHNLN